MSKCSNDNETLISTQQQDIAAALGAFIYCEFNDIDGSLSLNFIFENMSREVVSPKSAREILAILIRNGTDDDIIENITKDIAKLEMQSLQKEKESENSLLEIEKPDAGRSNPALLNQIESNESENLPQTLKSWKRKSEDEQNGQPPKKLCLGEITTEKQEDGYQEQNIEDKLKSFCHRVYEKFSSIFIDDENLFKEVKALVDIVAEPANQAIDELYDSTLRDLRKTISTEGIFAADNILVKGLTILSEFFQNPVNFELTNIDFAASALELEIEKIKQELAKAEEHPEESFGQFVSYEFNDSIETPSIIFITTILNVKFPLNVRNKATAIKLLKDFIRQGLDDLTINNIIKCIAQLIINEIVIIEPDEKTSISEKQLVDNQKENNKNKGKEKIAENQSEQKELPGSRQLQLAKNFEEEEFKLALELSKQAFKADEERAKGGSSSGQDEAQNQQATPQIKTIITTNSRKWFKEKSEKSDFGVSAKQIHSDSSNNQIILDLMNDSYEESLAQKAKTLDKQFNEKFPEPTNFIYSKIFLAALEKISDLVTENPTVFDNINSNQDLKELCE